MIVLTQDEQTLLRAVALHAPILLDGEALMHATVSLVEKGYLFSPRPHEMKVSIKGNTIVENMFALAEAETMVPAVRLKNSRIYHNGILIDFTEGARLQLYWQWGVNHVVYLDKDELVWQKVYYGTWDELVEFWLNAGVQTDIYRYEPRYYEKIGLDPSGVRPPGIILSMGDLVQGQFLDISYREAHQLIFSKPMLADGYPFGAVILRPVNFERMRDSYTFEAIPRLEVCPKCFGKKEVVVGYHDSRLHWFNRDNEIMGTCDRCGGFGFLKDGAIPPKGWY